MSQPAFPVVILSEQTGNPVAQELGLTKRELFAAMAMQGLLANQHSFGSKRSEVANNAVTAADALIAELYK